MRTSQIEQAEHDPATTGLARRGGLACMAIAATLLFSGQAPALTLFEAMEAAAANTEAAALLELDVDTAEAREQTALGEVLPLLTGTVSSTRNDQEVSIGDRTFVSLWDHSGNFRVTVDLFRGSSIPSWLASQRTTDGARERARWERAGLRRAAGRAFLAALTAREGAEAAAESLEVRRASLEETEVMLESGFVVAADVSRARLSLLDAETALLNAELALEEALHTLAFLVNAPSLTAEELVAPSPGAASLDGAVERQADLLAYDQDIAARSALVTGQWLSFLPVLSLAGQYNIGPESLRAPDGTFWTISLTATWLLFDYGRYGRLHEAEAERDAEQIRLAEAERQRDNDLSLARRQLEIAEERLAVAEQALRAAEETRDLEAERYALGDLTALEMIQANEDRFRAEIDLNLARLQRNLSLLEVAYLTGVLEDPSWDDQ